MNLQEKADSLQARVDAKFNPEQKGRLEEAKNHLRNFVRTYGPYAALALPLIASETLVLCFGDTVQGVEDSMIETFEQEMNETDE